MALDPSSTDPCSLLNAASYTTLFIPNSRSIDLAYPLIVNAGALVTYSSALNASSTQVATNPLTGINLTNAVLANPSSTSTFRLIQFLSGGGVAAANPPINYSTLQWLALRPYPTLSDTAVPTAPCESIVDTYIVGAAPAGLGKGTAYTYSTTAAPILSATDFWTSADASDSGSIKASPSSLLGKLIVKGYLLSQAQIYTPTQLTATGSPTAGTESLIYLYNVEQKSTLTQVQTTLKNTLEATNLRFFGAFMAEYCFYRTRYDWLLNQYFTVSALKTAANGGAGATLYTSPSTGSPVYQLFGTGNALPATSTASNLTQSDYLTGLAYQMACLNTRMTDMRNLLAAINTYYNGVFTLIQTNINSGDVPGGNAALTATIASLQGSADTANKYLTQQDFSKKVMEYNSEKNRYSNILLGLYAFLNIAALATVFHLARS
jgi:hypothetical protein